ncbi:MAG TPA: MFS transporter [Terriglobia bacterium]|nr:MFS transporter [Terriglobia bacterium]
MRFRRGTGVLRTAPVHSPWPQPFRNASRGCRSCSAPCAIATTGFFFSGQVISLVGTWMQSVAQSWLVYRLTGSSLLLGLVGFAGQFPVFLFAPIGGLVADRYSRHRIVIATQSSALVLAFILSALTLHGHIQVWQIMVLAAGLGLVNAFDIPARQAFIVEMVHSGDLINAIALNSSMVNGARVLGPAIAGVTVAAIGEGWCFFANGVSYIAVIVGLLLMVVPPRERVEQARSGLESIKEGFQFVARTGPIRALLLLLGLVSLTGMPYAVLMPIFADQILHGGARGLGMLMGASGIGALAGTLTLAAKREVRGLGSWISFASAGFGVSMIFFALSRSFLLSAALLVPVGFSMMLQMSSSNTLIQTMVPDALRGRVMAVYSMMFMGMAPIGALLAGAIAHHIGAPHTVALGGLTCLAGALVFGSRWPSLRGEARELILAQGMSSGEPPEEMTGQQPVSIQKEQAAGR